MKPKCQLRKTWPAIKPKGCKVHPKHEKGKRHKSSSSSNASAHSQTRSESLIERPAAKKPAARRITPVPMSSTPSTTASSFASSNSELPSQNSSKKRIEAIVERRIKSHNRQHSFKKGIKTIRRMTKIFGRY